MIVRFQTAYPPPTQPVGCAKLEDVRLAVALLAGAAIAAEEELARTTGPTRADLAAAGALAKIIQSCNSFESAVAGRAGPVVQLPSPATLAAIAVAEKTIAAVGRAPAIIAATPLPHLPRDAPSSLSDAERAEFDRVGLSLQGARGET
jgi:hypothetical protein